MGYEEEREIADTDIILNTDQPCDLFFLSPVNLKLAHMLSTFKVNATEQLWVANPLHVQQVICILMSNV
jgi:hypothetical protein